MKKNSLITVNQDTFESAVNAKFKSLNIPATFKCKKIEHSGIVRNSDFEGDLIFKVNGSFKFLQKTIKVKDTEFAVHFDQLNEPKEYAGLFLVTNFDINFEESIHAAMLEELGALHDLSALI